MGVSGLSPRTHTHSKKHHNKRYLRVYYPRFMHTYNMFLTPIMTDLNDLFLERDISNIDIRQDNI